MTKEFFCGNRNRLYAQMKDNSLLALFSGTEVRKTNDEYYPFYTNRNFLYLTGLDGRELALLARKDGQGRVEEKVFLLPPDLMAERWTGRRIKPNEAAELSGIGQTGFAADFEAELHRLAAGGNYEHLYLDLYRAAPTDRDTPAHRLLKRAASDYPFLKIENANALIRRLRTIKQPCELDAMRQAERVTCEGITAMMKASKPGMPMREVDGEIRRYNAALLKDAGVLDDVKNIGRYMWHGGAHHVGFDVHDVVETPEVIAPNMVFCVDVGIYHEEWGIGFRLEDNCLVTETGCENLSGFTPRTIEEIEDTMRCGFVAFSS